MSAPGWSAALALDYRYILWPRPWLRWVYIPVCVPASTEVVCEPDQAICQCRVMYRCIDGRTYYGDWFACPAPPPSTGCG
jgi:hypothetical protein